MSRKSFYKQSAKVNATSTTTLLEVEKPTRFTKSGEEKPTDPINLHYWRRWLFGGIVVCIIVLIFGILSITRWYWQSFETASGVSLSPLVQELWQKRNTSLFSETDAVSFLLLGVDQSINQREESLLTDTMIMGTIYANGSIKMVSFPRDLWIDSLKTKINALYYYGQQTNPGDGITLVSSVITEATGVGIQYYFIINMDTLKQLVDAVGGVEVLVQRSFVDTEYPREIDISSKDPAILYETIQFDAGSQWMNGDTALKFIRSRHSTDTFEGTDEGREQRQQLLISSLKKRLLDPKIFADPILTGNLFKVWKTAIKTNMTDIDAFLMTKQFLGKAITIDSAIIPIEDASQSGLIYHPKIGPANQWIFLPKDTSWNELKAWFKRNL